MRRAVGDLLYCDFKASSLRSNKITVIALALVLTSVWLAPILPTYAKLVSNTIKLSNRSAGGYGRGLVEQWLTIARIKGAVNKLRISSNTKSQSLSLLTLNILTDCKSALAAFKNVDSASVLGCANADRSSSLTKITRRKRDGLA
ncbi:MAG: hypothetical protein ACKERG_03390 [Candidatus Hodgkinia cicadicola]